MLEYSIRRILASLPLLIGLSLLVFFYVRIIPGDPIVAMLGVNSDPELVARLREQYGLDEPWWSQYWTWLLGLFRGDLGIAFRSGVPISEILIGRIPASLQLAVGGLLVGLTLALPAGVIAGLRRGTWIDSAISGLTLVGLAVPAFWTGAIAVVIFSVQLGWFPSGGYVPFDRDPVRNLMSLVLPSTVLGIAISPYLARLTRSVVIEVKQEPFVAFARAQGLSRGSVARSVVLRNAAPSLVVAVGVTVASLLAGSVIIESVFNWPGTGRLIVAAVAERDYAMIQALLMLYGALFIIVNLIAELAQGLLDPRIRY